MDEREKEISALFKLARLGPIDLEQHCIDRRLTVDDARYIVLTVTALLDADPGELGVRLRTDRIVQDAVRDAQASPKKEDEQ